MSFLTAVLSTAEESEIINVNKVYPKIQKNVHVLQADVKNYLDDIYVKYEQNKSDTVFKNACDDIYSKLTNISSSIQCHITEDSNEAAEELRMLNADLEESKYAINICNELLTINSSINSFDKHLAESKFVEASLELNKLSSLINNATPDVEYLDLYESMCERMMLGRRSLLTPISETWRKCLELSEDTKENSTSIKIHTNQLENFQKGIQVLVTLSDDALCSEMTSLCNFLLTKIFEPIIEFECDVKNTRDDLMICLQVTKLNTKSPKYSSVLENVRIAFQYLKEHLAIDDKGTNIAMIGVQISEQFCSKLINNCLIHTIPTTPQEMNEYNAVVSNLQTFQDELVEIKFLNPDNISLMDYANNVEVLFANNLCKSFMEKATHLMKKDLHNAVEVRSEQKDKLDFPKCQVSISVIELKDLLNNVMSTAVNSSEMCAVKLLGTIRSIRALYTTLVPQHHERLLKTIPQQVALFYNNCQYLSKALQEISTQYMNELSDILKGGPINLDVEVHSLQTTATDIFREQLQIQRKQILDILNESGLATLGQVPQMDINTEKSIRQCLRQLELLQTVWRKILPVDIYNKSLGTLLNALVGDLINRVIAVEDISVATATQLVAFYNLVKQRAPKVFTEPNEIHQYCKQWMKLSETIFVLEASLADIDGRWADGKGPLAHEFKPEQLRSLIRALFQNSDRRAAVLSKIK